MEKMDNTEFLEHVCNGDFVDKKPRNNMHVMPEVYEEEKDITVYDKLHSIFEILLEGENTIETINKLQLFLKIMTGDNITSEKQCKILLWRLRGKSTNEIGKILDIDRQLVEYHLKKITENKLLKIFKIVEKNNVEVAWRKNKMNDKEYDKYIKDRSSKNRNNI